MPQKTHRLAVLGFGPVGRSFAEILSEKREQVERDYGVSLKIVAAVDRSGAAWCGADRLGRDVPGVR